MSATPTTPRTSMMRAAAWKSALRRPSFLVAVGVFVALAVVWGILLFRSGQQPSLDQRAHDVASQIQCPVCNGESVADSPSGLASEMRGVIRQKLAQGESEQQVIQYFEARYGDTILESPPKQGFTTLIWAPPVLMLVVGAYAVFTLGREWGAMRPATAPAGAVDELEAAQDLSEEERRRLHDALMRELERDEGIPFSAGAQRKERA